MLWIFHAKIVFEWQQDEKYQLFSCLASFLLFFRMCVFHIISSYFTKFNSAGKLCVIFHTLLKFSWFVLPKAVGSHHFYFFSPHLKSKKKLNYNEVSSLSRPKTRIRIKGNLKLLKIKQLILFCQAGSNQGNSSHVLYSLFSLTCQPWPT